MWRIGQLVVFAIGLAVVGGLFAFVLEGPVHSLETDSVPLVRCDCRKERHHLPGLWQYAVISGCPRRVT
jgi:hypothetical protein